MATTASFNDMLKAYMPYSLLMEQMKRRNWFWSKVAKKTGWKGGVLQFPFEGAEASSLSFGALTASSDIHEHTEVLGTISTQPELWGSMKFNEKDLDRHGDLESSYLEIAPQKIKQFIDRMSERVSICTLNDGAVCTATADGNSSGELTLDHPERLTLGELVSIDDTGSSPVAGYVRSINMETKVVTFYDARTAGSVVNLSGYALADDAKVYLVSGTTAGFNGLGSQLLSSANGGASTIAGQTKTAYPFLQAQQHDGSTITATNILEAVFDAFYNTSALGKGNPTEIVMDLENFKNCVKTPELNRNYEAKDKAAGYGFNSITLIGNSGSGSITLTGVRDMPKDKIYILDWDAFKFHGDKFFDRKRHLDGNEFFLERATTGYSYLVDVKFYGDLVVHNPSHCGVIHSISY
jgi:hypothetical protein